MSDSDCFSMQSTTTSKSTMRRYRYRAENPLIPEPSPFVGAASCVSCHRKVSRSHEKSRHARTDLPFGKSIWNHGSNPSLDRQVCESSECCFWVHFWS